MRGLRGLPSAVALRFGTYSRIQPRSRKPGGRVHSRGRRARVHARGPGAAATRIVELQEGQPVAEPASSGMFERRDVADPGVPARIERHRSRDTLGVQTCEQQMKGASVGPAEKPGRQPEDAQSVPLARRSAWKSLSSAANGASSASTAGVPLPLRACAACAPGAHLPRAPAAPAQPARRARRRRRGSRQRDDRAGGSTSTGSDAISWGVHDIGGTGVRHGPVRRPHPCRERRGLLAARLYGGRASRDPDSPGSIPAELAALTARAGRAGRSRTDRHAHVPDEEREVRSDRDLAVRSRARSAASDPGARPGPERAPAGGARRRAAVRIHSGVAQQSLSGGRDPGRVTPSNRGAAR
jgi:hypothetical protein